MWILVYLACPYFDLGGNTFDQPMNKGNNSGFAMGQGIGSEVSFKLVKIGKMQSLRDVLCEAESLTKKLTELHVSLTKTRNEKRLSDIRKNISILQDAAAALTGKHQEMSECKEKIKTARSDLIQKV